MKTALVTGADHGLGLALVQALKKRGYEVFAAVYNGVNLGGVVTVKLDVTDDESIEKAYRKITKHVKYLDLLINNAGLNQDSPGQVPAATTQLGKLDRQAMRLMFDVNTFGPLFVTQQFAPLLKGGKVINISSYRASFADRDAKKNYGLYGYSGSKVALNMITRDLAHDLQGQKTAVYAINPGSVKTAMHANGQQAPAEAADRLLSAIEKLSLAESGRFFDTNGQEFPL